MKIITSLDNENIKYLNSLNNKKDREETGEFFIENLKAIIDAFNSGFIPVMVFINNNLLELNHKEIADIIAKSKEVFVINERINKKFSNLETPSGVAAVFKKIEGKIDTESKNIYLNGINDPGNLGTILRTALALGFKNIVVDERCADVYNYKTLNASKDAVFKLNIINDENGQFFRKLKDKMKVYATNLEGGKDLGIINSEKFCLVFGSEAAGVSEEILNQADDFIRLEMSGQMESLNVAVACGIILYELRK